MLQALDQADDLIWTTSEGRLASKQATDETVKAFGRFGIVLGQTPPDEAARWINASLIRDRLLTALDLMLAQPAPPALFAILQRTDPDPFRDAYRRAIQTKEPNQMRALAARPEMPRQPARFTAALGEHNVILPTRRTEILQDALRQRPR